MKFRILVRVSSGAEWWEEYDEETDNPDQWGKDIVKFFNSTLREGERPRTFIRAEVIDTAKSEGIVQQSHDWVKDIRGMSVYFRGHVVDIMYCNKCGITGKRYGLSSRVRRDSKYRSKKYEYCSCKDCGVTQ